MIIIDASVGVKLIKEEEGTDAALHLLTLHEKGKETIVVPDLFYIEIANYLATKTEVAKQDIRRSLRALYKASFEKHLLTQNDLMQATLFAKQYGTSVYDMLYAIIARNKKITLITSDNKFVKKVNFPFVKFLSALT